MLKVGLRFRRGDARVLESYAQMVRNNERMGDLATFEQAAQAALIGEPLVVICDNVDEAHTMASLYANCGIRRPAVEALSGE